MATYAERSEKIKQARVYAKQAWALMGHAYESSPGLEKIVNIGIAENPDAALACYMAVFGSFKAPRERVTKGQLVANSFDSGRVEA